MKTATSYQLVQWGYPPVPVAHSVPEPSGSEVIMRVTHAGVCHSDVYIMDGYQDLGAGERLEFADSTMPMPLTMGHEVVGEVVQTGPDADPTLLGKRRLVYPWIGCGNCPTCMDGVENHCQEPRILGIFRHGGYGDFIRVPADKYLVGIGDIDPAWASTLACSGLTVYSAFKQLMPLKSKSHTAIIGMGGLGLTAVAIAKALEIENIVACDIADDRLEKAKELGADIVLNTGEEGAAEKLKELTNGRLYGVLDTVGLPATLQLGMDSVLKGGKIIFVGLQGGRMELQLPLLPLMATSIIGTYTGTLQELGELVEMAKAGKFKPLPVECRSMKCLHQTLEELRSGEVLGRIVLQPEGSETS